MEKKHTNKYEFFVEGMHCGACELLIEKKLKKQPGVNKVKASLNSNTVTIECDSKEATSKDQLASDFSKYVEADGYTILASKPSVAKPKWGEFKYAVPFGLCFVFIIIVLWITKVIQFTGSSDEVLSYPAIFMIGIVASLSSCMAVVGGMVLSMSATYAKESAKGKLSSQVAFHTGRIISFFILGGILGAAGGVLSPVYIVSGILGLLVTALILSFLPTKSAYLKITVGLSIGFVIYFILSTYLNSTQIKAVLSFVMVGIMLILAINMMDIFPFFNKLQPRIPKIFSSKIMNLNLENSGTNFLTPIFLGATTFFLPCGFTNMMQFNALGSGDFLKGAMIMFVFALGTLPILGSISYTSIKLAKSSKKGIFFKAAGIVVIFFALVNLMLGLTMLEFMPAIISF
jgi:uncharacterized protein